MTEAQLKTNAELLKKKLAEIELHFDSAKEICKLLAPLPERAQRRMLTFFQDLVTDPDAGDMKQAAKIMHQVRDMLGVK